MQGFFDETNRMLDRFLTPAVKLILVINVAITLLLNILRIFSGPFETVMLVLAQTPALSLHKFWIWQFVTYAFVHVDFWHLLFNMLMLWFFGPSLENRWGTRRFWQFYLIVAVGAGLFHAILTTLGGNPIIPIIGASGAVYGVMLAYAAYYPEQTVLVWGVFPMKIKTLMIILVVFTFLASASAMRDNISHLTHLTGLGVAYVWLALHHSQWDIRRWRWTRG